MSSCVKIGAAMGSRQGHQGHSPVEAVDGWLGGYCGGLSGALRGAVKAGIETPSMGGVEIPATYGF
jgi:hypothetical protein